MAGKNGSFTERLFGGLFSRSEIQTQEEPKQDEINPEELEEILTRKIELQTMQKFQDHRVALQKYRSHLDKWEESLNDREERLLEQKEELEKSKKYALDEIIKEKSKLEDATQTFNSAVYRTDSGTMEWILRVDKKERKAIDEIRQKVSVMDKHAQSFSRVGSEFEAEVAEIMKANGFTEIEATKSTGKFGADIIASKDDIKYVVQCKSYSSAVGVDAVQEVYAAKVHYNAHVAVVAANTVFSKAASILAKESGVLLWDCEKLNSMRTN